MSDCGHCCCAIRMNSYHGHADAPEGCGRCSVARYKLVGDLATPMTPALETIVASVMDRVVPGIPGLPAGEELQELVEERTLEVYLAGLTDPDLLGLDPDSWRTIVAIRVGLVLAFPHR
jgi:hypothetical protein